jgi:GMP synthase (glutamine-hydrolysing)
MAAQLGGRVEPGAVHEFGYAEVRARGHSALLRDIEDRVNAEGHGLLDVWMSHGDRVVELPPGFKVSAATPDLPIAGMADESRRLYALQFHPEVTHTRQGVRIYERFLHGICGCDAGWNAGNIIEDAVARVRAQVVGGKVLLGLSGGVDSSVVAALLHKAIGDQLTCVFVDHGLLRHHEGDQVMAGSSALTPPSASSRRWRACRTPRPSARSSAACSSRSSTRRRTSSRASSSWRRERSTPT